MALALGAHASGVAAQTFTVTDIPFQAYVINGQKNPALTLVRGQTYTFNVNTSGHPLWLKSVQGPTQANAYNDGVTNNGVQVGTLTFAVPLGAPSTLFYNCEFHAPMTGTITIVDPSPTATATVTPTPTMPTAPTPTPTSTPPAGPCVGDCTEDREVTVDEILTLVNIALDTADISTCAHGIPSGSSVDVALIIHAVSNALNGCSGPKVAEVWLTTSDQGHKLEPQPDRGFVAGAGTESMQIRVDAIPQQYQQIDGFGAAVTDSSAWLIATILSETQRDELMQRLFSPSRGIGISYVRVPIGGSDFVAALKPYTYDDTMPGEIDRDLTSFSIDHDTMYILPILRRAREINPKLKFMGSPWSAPAWMKLPPDGDSEPTLNGGTLNPDYYAVYANYLVRFIQAYHDNGIDLDALTVQNEPDHEDKGYPSMPMTAEAEAAFVKVLGPTLASNSLATKIVIWDHNWDNTSYPEHVLADDEANLYIDGSAWHGYTLPPAPGALTLVHNAYPKKNIYFTEISGYQTESMFPRNLRWSLHYILMGATRNWARTALYWNIALDQNHGPSSRPPNANQLRGVVTIRTDMGAVDYEVEYYAIGHLSRFVVPDAHRIASDTWVDGKIRENPEPPDGDGVVESVAFKNPDRSTVLVVLNPSWHNAYTFDVVWNGRVLSYKTPLPQESVVTFKWQAEG